MPRRQSYNSFEPSPELISLLQSSLFFDSQQGLPELPKDSGQLVYPPPPLLPVLLLLVRPAQRGGNPIPDFVFTFLHLDL
jgi:hypothetical protein